MRLRPLTRRRGGAALVESSLILFPLLVLLLGTVDLGNAVLKYHTVSLIARQGTREAIVHGSQAAQLGPWNGGNYQDALNDALAPYLSGLNSSPVTITAAWIDGGNNPGQRVQVQVTTSYQPILTSVFAGGPINIQATSTMPIAH